ncbi:MAG: RDD family protein [Acidimicrobiales bacterium]
MAADTSNVVGKRVVAAIIDVVLVFVINFFIGLIFGGAEAGGITGGSFVGNLLGLAVNAGNYVVLQGATGATVGKHLLGLRVVDQNGQLCGYPKALIRWLLWIVDGFPYCIPGLTGLILVLATKDHRRLGDMAAGTYVVDASRVGNPLQGGAGGFSAPGAPSFGAPTYGANLPQGPGGFGQQPTYSPPTYDQPGYAAPQQPADAPFAPSAPTAPPTEAPAQPPMTGAETVVGWQSPLAQEPSAGAPGQGGGGQQGGGPSDPNQYQPQWDAQRNAYIQWDPAGQRWMQYDDATKSWFPIS